MVRSNRGGNALRGCHGNALVGGDRNRDRRTQRSANLSPCRIADGRETLAHVVQSDFACGASVYRQWNETRLGIRLAFAHGCRDLRYDPDWLWAWAAFTLRS